MINIINKTNKVTMNDSIEDLKEYGEKYNHHKITNSNAIKVIYGKLAVETLMGAPLYVSVAENEQKLIITMQGSNCHDMFELSVDSDIDVELYEDIVYPSTLVVDIKEKLK